MMKMTIGQYAKSLGIPRDNIYKRIKNKMKIEGVSKVETIAGIKFLHVKQAKKRRESLPA